VRSNIKKRSVIVMKSSSTRIPFAVAGVIAVAVYSATAGPNFYGPAASVGDDKKIEVIEMSAEAGAVFIKTVEKQLSLDFVLPVK
jgi:hypothetical protein